MINIDGISQIDSVLETSSQFGMFTMEQDEKIKTGRDYIIFIFANISIKY